MSELEHLIQILERIEKRQNEFFSTVMAMDKCQGTNTKLWVDSNEVQKILGISRRTLSRIVNDDILISKIIRGRTYFYTPSIFEIKNQYLK